MIPESMPRRRRPRLRNLRTEAFALGALGPLALLGGLRSGWGKMRGVGFGLRGGRVTEAHVSAWVKDD